MTVAGKAVGDGVLLDMLPGETDIKLKLCDMESCNDDGNVEDLL